MAVGAREPTIFWSWYRELLYQTYEGRLPTYHPSAPLHRWMAQGLSPWHTDLRALERRAMDSALVHGADAPWGRVHRTIMEHPLGSVAVLNSIFGFNVAPSPTGATLTRSTWRSQEAVATILERLRALAAPRGGFGDVDGGGGFILPTGQSGHPMSAHYAIRRRAGGRAVVDRAGGCGQDSGDGHPVLAPINENPQAFA